MTKPAVLLSILLITIPSWVMDFKKDRLTVFASLSYYKVDFDGDKLGDLSVWDPKTNTLYFQQTSDNKFYQKKFFENKLEHDPVFADYDGDGKTDFAFFQMDSGEWSIFPSSGSEIPVKSFFGALGDLPIPSNLDGDNKYEIGIWRPVSSAWLLTGFEKDGSKKPKLIHEGSYQDSTFSGDYDGDKKSDLIVWRPDDGYWHIVKSSNEYDFNNSEHIQNGQEWDIIVPNDYNGDGKCDLVLWRPQNQNWYLIYAGSLGQGQGQSQNQIKFGEKGDIPLSSDLDGDGIAELITWNMQKKSWNVLNFKKQESLSYNWTVPDGCIPASSILQKYE